MRKEFSVMDDKQIIDLYWKRSEIAISETDKKYGRYCHYIAYNILYDEEDSRECVNDAYLKTWEAIPPHRPSRLATFLGKITRNVSLNRYKYNNANKRSAGQVPLVLEELQECIPSATSTEQVIDDLSLADLFNQFLSGLSEERRNIFMRRYWYLNSVKEIARDFEMSESKVKMSLLRSRNELKQLLEGEGIVL